MIGVHKLPVLNFYPFLQKYITPHQRDVTQVSGKGMWRSVLICLMHKGCRVCLGRWWSAATPALAHHLLLPLSPPHLSLSLPISQAHAPFHVFSPDKNTRK